MWPSDQELLPISSEIKSKQEQAVEQQSISQIFGMFHSCQIVSLGLIQKSKTIQVQVILQSDDIDDLTLHNNNSIDHCVPQAHNYTYKKLARLIILFLFCVWSTEHSIQKIWCFNIGGNLNETL